MGDNVVKFPNALVDDHELIADLCRFAEGIFSEQEVKKRHRLADNVWQKLGEDDLLVEKIEAEKIRRIRDGSSKREKAQKLVVAAPDVLESIMSDPATNPKHRIDSAVVLDRFAANGPEKTPAADRFIISIHLGADTEHYNKSIKIDANDVAPEDTPQVAAITAKKEDDDGGQGYF